MFGGRNGVSGGKNGTFGDENNLLGQKERIRGQKRAVLGQKQGGRRQIYLLFPLFPGVFAVLSTRLNLV
jgi:hypothetical protein